MEHDLSQPVEDKMILMKNFFVSLALFLVLDWIWFSVFMKAFARHKLHDLIRISSDGELQTYLIAAGLAYGCMSLLVSLFLVPRFENLSWAEAVSLSALLGLLVFGIFDFTNMAILKSYPYAFVFIDVAWGTFLFALVGGVLYRLQQ